MHPRNIVFGALLAVAGAVASASSATAAPSTTSAQFAAASVACRYVAHLFPRDGGFQGSVEVTNTGTEGLTDWRIEFDLSGNAHITNYWNGGFITLHSPVRVMPASWNGHLAVGDSVEPGFIGINSDTVSISYVKLNDTACERA